MDATRALEDHAAGNPDAAARLLPLVYQNLRDLAARYMRHERPDHTLTPTALVHEAYLRLVDETRISWQGKTHFFAIAAKQMRRVLVDSARAHRARKRGGDLARVTLEEEALLGPGLEFDVLALHEALESLEKLSTRQSDIVELRFFGGLEVQETAFVLGVSERTVKREWRVARAWLLRELKHRQRG